MRRKGEGKGASGGMGTKDRGVDYTIREEKRNTEP